jgi:hypothetical protein
MTRDGTHTQRRYGNPDTGTGCDEYVRRVPI